MDNISSALRQERQEQEAWQIFMGQEQEVKQAMASRQVHKLLLMP